MFECPVCQFVGLRRQPYATWPPPEGLAITPPYDDWLGRGDLRGLPDVRVRVWVRRRSRHRRPMSFAEYRADWESRGSPVFRPDDVAQINATREADK